MTLSVILFQLQKLAQLSTEDFLKFITFFSTGFKLKGLISLDCNIQHNVSKERKKERKKERERERDRQTESE
jgi:hypothetical protein